VLNVGERDAHLSITIFFADREPAGPYRLTVPARWTRPVRFNDLTEPAPIPTETDYASLIESDVSVAYPDRQCVGFVGDGGFAMLMAEFATAVKHRLPIKVIVVRNDTLGQIKWEQMVFLGNPEYGCELQPIDFVAFARACGGAGFRIEDPEQCGAILDEALATPGPVVVGAVVDPFTPPMPPKVTARQAVHLAESLARGEPHRGKIASTILADKVRELI
jgi:pyruvate dehydrogenase (quinone)/pyruvate oxidase